MSVIGGESEREDWAGIVHPPAGREARIACMVPSITELLFALNLGDAVVARTGFCVHPRGAVKAVRKIGGTKDFDLAALRELSPTHLVVNVEENRKDAVEQARAFVPNVIVTHPADPLDNLRLYALLGSIFARDEEAAALAAQFRDALAELDGTVRLLAREHVLYLIWRKPWMSVTRATYVGATLARAGWDALPDRGHEAPARPYPIIPADDPVWRGADRILVSSEPYAFRERDVRELVQCHGKPTHLVDGEMTSWYGPRAIAGMRYLARLRADLASTTAEP